MALSHHGTWRTIDARRLRQESGSTPAATSAATAGSDSLDLYKVKKQSMKWLFLIMALGALLTLGACGKKAVPPPPPPPPPPPAPTASISVTPNTIQGGQSASLTWQTGNATDVSIDGIGAVQPNGSQSVSPADSTTYHLDRKSTRL